MEFPIMPAEVEVKADPRKLIPGKTQGVEMTVESPTQGRGEVRKSMTSFFRHKGRTVTCVVLERDLRLASRKFPFLEFSLHISRLATSSL